MGIWIRDIAMSFGYLFLYYSIALNLSYLLMALNSFFRTMGYFGRITWWDFDLVTKSNYTSPISILSPAHNEERNIIESVRSLLSLNYPNYEVVVVNDGSTDGTLKLLIEEYKLELVNQVYKLQLPTKPIKGIYVSTVHCNLRVIDKEQGGKADALNAGINVTKYPLFCAVDADTILEKDALLRIAKPMLEDDTVVATAGIVRIVNGSVVKDGRVVDIRIPFKLVPLMQIVEYFRSFLANRTTWSCLNTLLIISGAFGLFRKEIVIAVGGYSTKTVGEDMEIVMKMHEYLRRRGIKYSIKFISDPVCWTEAPSSLVGLSRQRFRWHRGLIECLISYTGMFLNPRYGLLGMLTVPYFWIFEMLAPVVEILGYSFIVVGFVFQLINYDFLRLLIVASIIFGTLISFIAIILEEMTYRRYQRSTDLLCLFGAAILENFIYRQLSTIWRVRAIFGYFFLERKWGKSERKGFTVPVTDRSGG